MSLVDDYLKYQDKYQKKYGLTTLVFMQVGSFYEAYSTKEKGYNLIEIADLCNIICTKKDKKKEDSPSMLGFPTISLQKYLKILLDEGLTVVVIDQVTPAPNPKREVTGIYSSGTYIDDCKTPDSNNIIGLYFDDDTAEGSASCIGIVCIDLTTGKTIVHQTMSSHTDKKYAMDETNRFIINNSPTEVIIYRKSKNQNLFPWIISQLDIDRKKIHLMDIGNDFLKVSYQNEFLKKVYKQNNCDENVMLSTIEYLDMERMLHAVMALVLTLDYAYQHNNNILTNISKPFILEDDKHMIIGNDAVYQLNIIGYNDTLNTAFKGKYKSIFDVVNKTSTAMGKRYLKSRICSPIMDEETLNKNYELIGDLMKEKFYEKIQVHLKCIMDIERYHRKISLGILHPYEFVNLLSSYSEIIKIMELLSLKDLYSFMHLPEAGALKDLISECSIFNMEEMKKYHLDDIQTSLFTHGAFPELDEIQQEIEKSIFFIDESARILSSFIAGHVVARPLWTNGLDDKIKVKKTEKDGYFLSITKLRAKTLIANLKEMEIMGIKTKPGDIKIKELDKGNSKITFPGLDRHSDLINKNKTKVVSETKKYYLSFLDIFYESKDYLNNLVDFVSYFDYVVSNTRVAVEYNYCKPRISSICDSDQQLTEVEPDVAKSFVEAKKLRHPLIERIIDVEYIPHDISLGKGSIDGMLIYGINSAGKSSLMKSVGVSLIMAQCGMYVPAESFNFKPYKSLYARISSNDNLFRGLSSFAIELTEIDSILKRATKNTLVIGDEVCKSTETISAHSLVAATLVFLSRVKASFIFATHLHDISKIKLMKELTNIRSYHLSVVYDESTKKLIFDRILKEGQGDSVYGITVAKFFIQNNDFMKLTNDICHDLNDSENSFVSTRRSRYNASLIVDECLICHAKDSQNFSYLDTHHINFQKNCENGFVTEKPHIPIHSLCNLVTLCKKCHKEVHNGTLDIKGYIQTSNGRELEFEKK